MIEVVSSENWSYKSCKAPVKSSPPTNQHPVFLQAGCPSCRQTKSVKVLKGKYHIPWTCLPKLTWGLPTLSLATNSSRLPWRRVAMPLISPLMLVPQLLCYITRDLPSVCRPRFDFTMCTYSRYFFTELTRGVWLWPPVDVSMHLTNGVFAV